MQGTVYAGVDMDMRRGAPVAVPERQQAWWRGMMAGTAQHDRINDWAPREDLEAVVGTGHLQQG